MSYQVLPYHQSLALVTDLYQLTMANAYWKAGVADKEAVFHLSFRHHPFQGGFTIACGLGYVVDYLEHFQFDDSDLAYLASLTGHDGTPLLATAFLQQLGALRFSCDVEAVPEGTVVFPHEPLLRVQGSILQCQLLETVLLNIINFQTLIATKAARIGLAARGEPIIEFGLRRAHGMDGALAASRAAYIGGCAATSNVWAGKRFGIPVKGTHAHSWVMSFEDELEAFQAYAHAMPNNCIFLVDTYDTLEGVKKAIEVGQWLKSQGQAFLGIRLDSGDLAYLSIEARKLLDAAGFTQAVIIASNDLDETIITSLKEQGAMINVWGVGTKLITGYDQPALGGVYKLSAVRSPGSPWRYTVKLSEQAAKISTPGILQIRRHRVDQEYVGDVIYDVDTNLANGCQMIDPFDATRQKRFSTEVTATDLLVPVFRQGQRVYTSPSLSDIRAHAQQELGRFHGGIKRFVHPHQYPVGLEASLAHRKAELIAKARGVALV